MFKVWERYFYNNSNKQNIYLKPEKEFKNNRFIGMFFTFTANAFERFFCNDCYLHKPNEPSKKAVYCL